MLPKEKKIKGNNIGKIGENQEKEGGVKAKKHMLNIHITEL